MPQMTTTEINSLPQSKEVECEQCGGVGWFGYPEAEPGEPDFGKAYPCECTIRAATLRRAEWVRQVCGLPVGLQDRTLENFEMRRLRSGGPAVAAIRCFVDSGGWLLLRGSYQKGKTHLAAATANRLLDKDEHVVFTYVKTFLDRLRQAISEPAGYIPLLDATKECPWLILDDLGVEKQSEWVLEQLEDIFNWRADHSLPLLVTTNLSEGHIKNMSPRIAARISRLADTVVLA